MEDNEPNKQPDAVDDKVARDDYNKVVEASNSAKADLEKVQKENEETKKKLEESTKGTEEQKKKMEELTKWKEQAEADAKTKKELEEKGNLKPNPKGLVPPPPTEGEPPKEGEAKEAVEAIKEHFGEMDTKIYNPQPNLKVLAHYQNPANDPWDNQTAGKLFALHGAHADQMGIPPEAGRSSDDWVIHKGSRRAT